MREAVAIAAPANLRRSCRGSWALGTACGECRPCLATRPASLAPAGGHKKGTEDVGKAANRARLLQLAGDLLGQGFLAGKVGGCLRTLGRYIRGDRTPPDVVLERAAQACEDRARELLELSVDLRKAIGE